MKRVLLDTSVYVAFKRNREDVVSGLQWASEIHLNTVVMAELLLYRPRRP